jgi:hypothetical protein
VYKDRHGYCAIAFDRMENGSLLVITKHQSVKKIREISAAAFSAVMRPVTLGDRSYPMDRAARVMLDAAMPVTDRALRVLRNLRDHMPLDEQHVEEILDTRPTAQAPHVRKQGKTTDERKRSRKAARAARLAAMTPKERAAYQKKRRERRVELRQNRSQS